MKATLMSCPKKQYTSEVGINTNMGTLKLSYFFKVPIFTDFEDKI